MENIRNKILCCDVSEGIAKLPDNSVDCVITSPPYWALRDYGIEPTIWGGAMDCEHEWKSVEGGSSRRKDKYETEANIKRAKKKGYTVSAWGASRRAAEGFDRAAIPETAFCRKCNAWRGTLGLEPDFNLYIKHLCDIFDLIKRPLKKTGTVWVNLGDSFQNKSLVGIPERFVLEMQNRGWFRRNTLIWFKPNCMPSSAKDRFTVDFEYVFLFSQSKKYYFERQFEPFNPNTDVWYRQELRAGKKYNTKKPYKGNTPYASTGAQTPTDVKRRVLENMKTSQGRNKRCVWKIPTQPFKDAHFATFPEALITPMIKAGVPEFVCKKCGKPREKIMKPTEEYAKFLEKAWHEHKEDLTAGNIKKGNSTTAAYKFDGWSSCPCNVGFSPGIVLDPFMGSGTTGLVARKLGRDFVGIEIKPEYVEMAKKRLKPFLEQKKLGGWGDG